MVNKPINPYFSIIIPVYRDTARLQLCLDAIGKMSHRSFDFEVIVVNNDPSIPVLDLAPDQYSYPIKEVYKSTPGSYAARNKGIQESRGTILGFTDSDCLPCEDWLELAYVHFLRDSKKEIGVLTGPVPLFFKNLKALSDAEVYEKYTGFTTESYAKEGHAITANWFSYKSVIEGFRGFNDDLKSNGDSELSGKISQKYKIIFAPELIVRHPARFHTSELVDKYKRLLGGVYTRRFQESQNGFRRYFFQFLWSRYRFAIKRLFTLSPKESFPILKVCHAINKGAIQEYFHLIKGGETKR